MKYYLASLLIVKNKHKSYLDGTQSEILIDFKIWKGRIEVEVQYLSVAQLISS